MLSVRYRVTRVRAVNKPVVKIGVDQNSRNIPPTVTLVLGTLIPNLAASAGTTDTARPDPDPIQSRSTVAPPQLSFQQIRWFQNQFPAVSPEIPCSSTPRRRRSIGLCTQENTWIPCFQLCPSLCRAAMKRSLKKTAGFLGGLSCN